MKTASLLLMCFPVAPGVAQDWRSYQSRVQVMANRTAPAVVPIIRIGEGNPGVRGSAFLINEDGYFLTAAHVLKEYVPHTAHLAVVFRQKDGEGGSGEWFDVIEKDDELDVALCQIRHFADIKKMGFFELGAVDLSTRALAVGRSVFIAGFPLGWWNASIQAGHIAAEHTILPPGGMFDLFQVGVAGNQGDSGGPVIDLETGEVVGIVVRGSFNVGSEEQAITVQSSGLMYAVPVSKLSGLLSKHKIQIETPRSVVRPGDTRHQRKSN